MGPPRKLAISVENQVLDAVSNRKTSIPNVSPSDSCFSICQLGLASSSQAMVREWTSVVPHWASCATIIGAQVTYLPRAFLISDFLNFVRRYIDRPRRPIGPLCHPAHRTHVSMYLMQASVRRPKESFTRST